MIRVKMTPAIERQLRTIMGAEANLEEVAVYEMIAVGSSPLNANGIYAGAVMSEKGMKALVAKGRGRPVPMIDNHDASSSLPVGRLLRSEVVKAEDGTPAVHSLIYLTVTGQEDRIAKLDTGVLRDVSVGFLPNSLACSTCGFDFMASQTNRELLVRGYYNDSIVCGNKHVMGAEDGTKLQVNGVKSWKETSFVSRGASEEGRILSQQFQKLSSQDFKVIPLAASEDDDTLFCNTNEGDDCTFIGMTEEIKMDIAAFKAEVELRVRAEEALKTSAQLAELETLKAQVAIIAELQAKADQVTGLTEQVATLTSERDQAKTDLAAAQARLDVLTANEGQNKKADPATTTELSETINSALFQTF